MLYPDVVTRGEFDNSYETIREIWRKCDEHTLKLTSIHYNTNLNLGSSGKIYTSGGFTTFRTNSVFQWSVLFFVCCLICLFL